MWITRPVAGIFTAISKHRMHFVALMEGDQAICWDLCSNAGMVNRVGALLPIGFFNGIHVL